MILVFNSSYAWNSSRLPEALPNDPRRTNHFIVESFAARHVNEHSGKLENYPRNCRYKDDDREVHESAEKQEQSIEEIQGNNELGRD